MKQLLLAKLCLCYKEKEERTQEQTKDTEGREIQLKLDVAQTKHKIYIELYRQLPSWKYENNKTMLRKVR